MSDQNPNLSKSQLAAIDLMIAQLEENKQANLGSFIGSIVDAVTNVASQAVNAVTNVATNAINEVTSNPIASVAAVAALAALKATQTGDLNKVVSEINLGEASADLTLENLIALRNKYAK